MTLLTLDFSSRPLKFLASKEGTRNTFKMKVLIHNIDTKFFPNKSVRVSTFNPQISCVSMAWTSRLLFLFVNIRGDYGDGVECHGAHYCVHGHARNGESCDAHDWDHGAGVADNPHQFRLHQVLLILHVVCPQE